MESKRVLNPDCFFCHKTFDNDSTVNVFNLRQLFRYLKIKLRLDQNSVLLCSQCNKSGCQLYHQIVELEVTQMKINHSLEQLVTNISRDSSSGSDALQKLVKEKCNPKIFCNSQLKNVKYPQIKLKRLARVHVISVTEDPVMSPSPSASSPAPSSAQLAETEETIVKMEVVDDQYNRPASFSTPKPKSRRIKSSTPKTCRFCAKLLHNSNECCYHEAENHPDQLLIKAKLDNVTDSHFLQICKHVLAKHNVIESTLLNNTNRYGCLYCQNLYGKMKYLKHHTIHCHLAIIIENVQKQQKTTSHHTTTKQDNNKDTNKNDEAEGASLLENVNHEIKLKRIPQERVVSAEEEENLIISELSSPPNSPAPLSPLSPEADRASIVNLDASSNNSKPNHKTSNKPKLPSKNPKACRFCPKLLTVLQVRQFHEVLLHPDKLLTKGKLDNISDSQFMEICQDLLATHKIVNNQHGCLYCTKCFVHMKCLKKHTIISHLPNTIEKVRQLQQTISQYSAIETGGNLNTKCQYCRNVFSNEVDLQNHKMTSCEILSKTSSLPEVQLLISETEDQAISEIDPDQSSFSSKTKLKTRTFHACRFCPKILTKLHYRQYHEISLHSDQLLLEGKLDNISDSQFIEICQDVLAMHKNVDNQHGCLYCTNSYAGIPSLKIHMIQSHLPNAIEKVRQLQQTIVQYSETENYEDVDIKCQYCGNVFTNQFDLTNHKMTLCKTLRELFSMETGNVSSLACKRYTCQFCPKMFQSSSALVLHSTFVHYVRYLSEAKLESISDEQFELCCQQLLMSQFTRKDDKVDCIKCAYCARSYKDVRLYRSHIIDKHPHTLYNKLKELQKDVSKIKVDKTQNGRIIHKVVCQLCGVWVGSPRLKFHLKYRCENRKEKLFFKVCKCHKKFYSMSDLKKHSCPGRTPSKSLQLRKSKDRRRVQCEKCGAQVYNYLLRQHQRRHDVVKPKDREDSKEQKRKTFVQKNMTDILSKMKTQMSTLVKTNKNTFDSSDT